MHIYSIAIAIAAALACTACQSVVVMHSAGQDASAKTGEQPLVRTSGTDDTWNAHGMAYVRGYAEVVPGTGGTPPYVFLHILEMRSAGLQAYLLRQEGNAFAGPSRIGLGCVQNGTLVYENQTDGNGMQTHTLAPDITNAIVHSSAHVPVELVLTKLPLGRGGGAPACYSHFSHIQLFAQE